MFVISKVSTKINYKFVIADCTKNSSKLEKLINDLESKQSWKLSYSSYKVQRMNQTQQIYYIKFYIRATFLTPSE
jgi:hypothetical protein